MTIYADPPSLPPFTRDQMLAWLRTQDVSFSHGRVYRHSKVTSLPAGWAWIDLGEDEYVLDPYDIHPTTPADQIRSSDL